MIAKLPRPSRLKRDAREVPFEATVWRVRAEVVEVKARPDGDFYLVLRDGVDQIVAEAPNQKACSGSVLSRQMDEARDAIGSALHPQELGRDLNMQVEVTGIGFFGTAPKGQNGARIMPILGFRVLNR